MTAKEQKQRERLQSLWATGRATKKQMLRCTELDRKDRAESQGAHHASA